MGISRSPIIALMPDLVPPEERSPANGVINFMGGFGSLLVYFVVGKISTTNRPLGFAIAGASVLVAAVIMFLSIKETRDSLDRKAPQSEHADFSLLRKMWTPKYRSLLLICLAIFFWFIAFNAIETYYPTYMHAESPAVRSTHSQSSARRHPPIQLRLPSSRQARQTSEASAKFNLGVFSLAFMVLSIPAGFIGKAAGPQDDDPHRSCRRHPHGPPARIRHCHDCRVWRSSSWAVCPGLSSTSTRCQPFWTWATSKWSVR